MNNKRSIFILVAVLLLSLCAVAQERSDEINQAVPNGTQIQTNDSQARTGQPDLGEQIEAELEAGMASIDRDFKTRMDGLKIQMAATRDAEEMDLLQQQAQQLKVDWSLALSNRQLELARARKDTQSEEAILETIENLMAKSSTKTGVTPQSPAKMKTEGGVR